MIVQRTTFLLLIASVISCGSNRQEKYSTISENNIADTISDKGVKLNDDVDSNLLQLSYFFSESDRNCTIKILSSSKKIDSTSNFLKKYGGQCNGWRINSTEIRDILLHSKKIDGHEFHYFYDVLPCSYVGRMNFNGKVAAFELNAGSFAIITYRDTSIYLGYDGSKYKKRFLSHPGFN